MGPLSKEKVYEIFTASGQLIQHLQDAGSAKPFDIVAYEASRARFLSLAQEIRDLARERLMELHEAKAKITPRDDSPERQ